MPNFSVMESLPNYENRKLCSKCGGKCCKHMPGFAEPFDFGAPNTDKMKRLLFARLSSRKWSLDWYIGDSKKGGQMGRVLMPRPSREVTIGKFGGLFDGAWLGGRCALLTDNGCTLPHDERPVDCRMLEPDPMVAGMAIILYECGCKWHGWKNKSEIAIRWRPYQRLIRSVARKVEASL